MLTPCWTPCSGRTHGLADTGRPHSNRSVPSHFTDEETEAQEEEVTSSYLITATTENAGCPLSGVVMSPEGFMWHHAAGLSDSILWRSLVGGPR